jgi:hypothetical protein
LDLKVAPRRRRGKSIKEERRKKEKRKRKEERNLRWIARKKETHERN